MLLKRFKGVRCLSVGEAATSQFLLALSYLIPTSSLLPMRLFSDEIFTNFIDNNIEVLKVYMLDYPKK